MRALLFGGTDGHGATMAIISERNLRSEGYEVQTYVKYWRSGPEHRVPRGEDPAKVWELLPPDCGTGFAGLFWGQTFVHWDFSQLGEGDLVVVVDIPLPSPVPYLPRAAERGLEAIGRLTRRGIRVVIVDHHKVAETWYGQARELGAEVIVASTAMATHYGPHDSFAEKWGRVGAICDRDPSVLPVTPEEERLAAALDAAVRRDLAGTLEALRKDDESFFKAFTESVPEPEEIRVIGNVVYIPRLEPTWGFKQLSAACERHGTPYGVGLSLQRGVAVIAITFWKAEGALPVALKLGLTNFIGSGEAVVIPVVRTEGPATPEEVAQGEEKAAEVIAALNSEGDGGPGNGGRRPGEILQQISQFMRQVRIPFFLTQHGWPHVSRVIANARTLGSLFGLSKDQQRLLDWAAGLHDIGNGAADVYPEEGLTDEEARARHHEFSARMVREWNAQGFFEGIMSPEEAELVARLCFAHRKKVPLPEDREERLLEVILRVADGIDIDARRAQKNDQGTFFEEIWDLPEDSVPHWEGHRAILALRLIATRPRLVFEVLVDEKRREAAAFQVKELTAELAPLTEFCDWEVVISAATARS